MYFIYLCVVYVHLRVAPYTVNAAPHELFSFTCVEHLKLHLCIFCEFELLITLIWERDVRHFIRF